MTMRCGDEIARSWPDGALVLLGGTLPARARVGSHRVHLKARTYKKGSGHVPQMWYGVSEHLLAPEPALPAQVYHIWHHTRAISAEKRLALAVLEQAVLDLGRYRFAKRPRFQRLYMEAYAWVASEDRSWPFAFASLCDAFDLDAVAVRSRLLDLSLPPSGLSLVAEAA